MEPTTPSCSSTFCLESSLKLQICYAHGCLYGKKIYYEYGSQSHGSHIEYAGIGEKESLYIAKIGLQLLQKEKEPVLSPPPQIMYERTLSSFESEDTEDVINSLSYDLPLFTTRKKKSEPPLRQIMEGRDPKIQSQSMEEDLLSLVHLRQSASLRRLATCISSYICCHLLPFYRTVGWGIQPAICWTICCSIACETGHDIRDQTGEFVNTFCCDQPPTDGIDLARRTTSPCWLFCCSSHSNRHFLLPAERDLYTKILKKHDPVDDWIRKIYAKEELQNQKIPQAVAQLVIDYMEPIPGLAELRRAEELDRFMAQSF